MSLPSWECGLKFDKLTIVSAAWIVTPFVGVWIEILTEKSNEIEKKRHSLRGSVD